MSAADPAPPEDAAPLPQAWVPRVLNGAIAVVLLLIVSPIVVTWGDRTTVQRVFLTAMAVVVLFVAAICAVTAIRPGALGRVARRARERRTAA